MFNFSVAPKNQRAHLLTAVGSLNRKYLPISCEILRQIKILQIKYV